MYYFQELKDRNSGKWLFKKKSICLHLDEIVQKGNEPCNLGYKYNFEPKSSILFIDCFHVAAVLSCKNSSKSFYKLRF